MNKNSFNKKLSTKTPMKLRARSDADKEIRRRKLLDHALELFSRFGFQGASIEMITKKAGVSTGTFYLYFKNKVEIYRVLNTQGIDILYDLMEEAISWPGMTPSAQLLAIATSYYKFSTEYRGYYNILAILSIGQKDFLKEKRMLDTLNARAKKILDIVESILKKGVETGELQEMDTWQTSNALWGMMDGLILLEFRRVEGVTGHTFKELFKRGIEILTNGVLTISTND